MDPTHRVPIRCEGIKGLSMGGWEGEGRGPLAHQHRRVLVAGVGDGDVGKLAEVGAHVHRGGGGRALQDDAVPEAADGDAPRGDDDVGARRRAGIPVKRRGGGEQTKSFKRQNSTETRKNGKIKSFKKISGSNFLLTFCRFDCISYINCIF